ncbi:MAG: dihydroorotate dehydrogenase electron transfer subunit [Acidobacteriota bacterium]|nr:dihydroorotate dehydrogenase electron transfer subunit [Acidobacteriota bacterium]
MQDAVARVLSVTEHPLPYYSIRLSLPAVYDDAEPGQFVMVQVGDRLEPYLRRPFSVFDVAAGPSGVVGELLGKVVGRGTELMAKAEPGDEYRVLGPLGRGFTLRTQGRSALVAGGVGSAALLLLARSLAAQGGAFDFYYGGRNQVDLPCHLEFGRLAEQSGGRLVLTTEDGSAGAAGLVTAPLDEELARGSYDFVYSCGPMGLLKRLAELAVRHGVDGEAALETAMGCGYGACLGCAVPHVEGRWALCCKDGPVFGFSEVRW